MIKVAKEFDLGLPHATVEGETVKEYEGLSLAGTIIVEADIIEIGVRHGLFHF